MSLPEEVINTARLNWIFSQISATFNFTSEDRRFNLVSGNAQENAKLLSFLRGESGQCLMYCYNRNVFEKHFSKEKLVHSGVIILNGKDGGTSGIICFLRCVPHGVEISLDVASSDELLCLDIPLETLHALNVTLSEVFFPLVEKEIELKKSFSSDQDSATFLLEFKRLCLLLHEGQKLTAGSHESFNKADIELDHTDFKVRPYTVENAALITKFVNSWLDEVDEYFHNLLARHQPGAGPKAEYEFWKTLNYKLSEVYEYLKASQINEAKNYLSVICQKDFIHYPRDVLEVASKTLKKAREKMQWLKELKVDAMQHLKYCDAIHMFIAPLYSGNPREVLENLDTLFVPLKLTFASDSLPNAYARLSRFLKSISNQIVQTCKEFILGTEDSAALLNEEPSRVLKRIQICCKLCQTHQESTRNMQGNREESPIARLQNQQGEDALAEFTYFLRRIEKLEVMLAKVLQFDCLAKHNFDGINVINEDFQLLLEEFKLKRHDLLDYSKNRFDRDYVEFSMNLLLLEQRVQKLMIDIVDKMNCLDTLMLWLQFFERISDIKLMKDGIDVCITIVLKKCSSEILMIQEHLEANKQNPPIPRNVPYTIGKVMWIRQLQQRVMSPLVFIRKLGIEKRFLQKIELQSTEVLKNLELCEEETIATWRQTIESCSSNKIPPIFLRDAYGKVSVNLPHELICLAQEAKTLREMGIETPNNATMLSFKDNLLQNEFRGLLRLLEMYYKLGENIPHKIKVLVESAVHKFENLLQEGVEAAPQSSINVVQFTRKLFVAFSNLKTTVITVTHTVERIDKQLNFLLGLSFLPPNKGRYITLPRFTQTQIEYSKEVGHILKEKAIEIERESDSLLSVVDTSSEHSAMKWIAKDKIADFKLHSYQELYYGVLHAVASAFFELNASWKLTGGVRRQLFSTELKIIDGCILMDPSTKEIEESVVLFMNSILDSLKELEPWNIRVLNKDSNRGESHHMMSGFDTARSAGYDSFWGSSTHPHSDNAASEGSIVSLERGGNNLKNAGRRLFAVSQLGLTEFLNRRGNEEKVTLAEAIRDSEEIAKAVIICMGTVHEANAEVCKNIDSYGAYLWLWKDKIKERYQKFASKNPSLEQFQAELQIFANTEISLKQCEPISEFDLISLKAQHLHEQITSKAREWIDYYTLELHKQAKSKLDALVEETNRFKYKVEKDVTDIELLREVMEAAMTIRQRDSDIDKEIEYINEVYATVETYLTNYGSTIEQQEVDQRLSLAAKWSSLMEKTHQKQHQLNSMKDEFKLQLTSHIEYFESDVKAFKEEYERDKLHIQSLPAQEALLRVKRFRDECEIQIRKQHIYAGTEELFGLRTQQFTELAEAKQEIEQLISLYELHVKVIDTINEYTEIHLEDMAEYIPAITSKIQSYSALSRRLPQELVETEAFKALKLEMSNALEVLPLLEELSKKSIMARHWKELEDLTGKPLTGGSSQVTLQTILDANILSYKEAVFEICSAADKQLAIEEKINEITLTWSEADFTFSTWKSRQYPCVLVGDRVAEIQETLEESQIVLNTLNTMKQVQPFRKSVVTLLTALSDTADILDSWVKVQQLWISMENLFTAGDIAAQMPTKAKHFQQIDRDWTRIMATAADMKNVVECCQLDMVKQLLPNLKSGLESCQKSLEFYLEGKKRKFPRFYFISDALLLLILSSPDPYSIQENLERLFDSISRVEFDGEDRKKITTIKYVQGTTEEKVSLLTPVKVEGSIEDWLLSLEYEMQRAIRKICQTAAGDTTMIHTDISMREYCDRYIAQVAQLGLQLVWTSDCHNALEDISNNQQNVDFTALHKKFTLIMNELVEACMSDLGSKMDRTKYETLVTTHIHQRDVFSVIWKKVRANRMKNASDFEWLKHPRLYWKADKEDIILMIADVQLSYAYEYLGVKERLVITPLTNRCFLTCSQALGMCYGGAPMGPAGTGKTETVKDLGRMLGKYVIVTNCSNQHRYKDIAKILKGVCQSGVWSCFDEFNRIDLEVLSVVATQVESITLAKRQGLNKFMFPGESDPIKLVPSSAYFITMNPGYAGRQELPENLKALFRSVSMMIPDAQFIIKVKLASSGFSDVDRLSRKFKLLYDLCKGQLSAQKHYDFGLRNILSVLRTAGAAKRADPDTDERLIIVRAVQDGNLSALVAEDVPLFLALLQDLFPMSLETNKIRQVTIERAVRDTMKALEMRPSEAWIKKVLQFYEISLVRHGIIIVGSTCSGKSSIYNILSSALTTLGTQTRTVSMNPKSITSEQMYGTKDPISEEWTNGIFASIWSKYNMKGLKYNVWIVLDGPVDSLWIENLNTVLDDNKILTLPNNDRIPMTDNTRLVLEVETLNNASPATVSRTGIVYLSVTDLSWEPLVECWISQYVGKQSNQESKRATLKSIFDNCLLNSEVLTFISRETSTVLPMTETMLVIQTLNFFSGLLINCKKAIETFSTTVYETLLIHSIVWGVGGLLEFEDRKKFDLFIRKYFKTKIQITADKTVYDYRVDEMSGNLIPWDVEKQTLCKPLRFHSILIPTIDSQRAGGIMKIVEASNKSTSPPCFKSTLIVGDSGTAKTSSVLMYSAKFEKQDTLFKRLNFSHITSPEGLQQSIEAEVERKSGKTFCPPGGLSLTFFLDDVSMPAANRWGDQATLELARQLIEQGGFYFLEKDRRGDFKTILELQFIAAMKQPGAGRSSIPQRLQSKFFCFNMTTPSVNTIDSIYGSILSWHFMETEGVSEEVRQTSMKITSATIDLWEKVRATFLPTPSRFHYIFSMRDLSNLFEGILSCPLDVVTNESKLVSLWRNESMRAFSDKLSRRVDKQKMRELLNEVSMEYFGQTKHQNAASSWFCNFLRQPYEDENGEYIFPSVYEPVPSMAYARNKVLEYIRMYNEERFAEKINIVLFDEALEHLMSITRIIRMPRGSAMLVGLGVSGKQTLARLASYIVQQKCVRQSESRGFNKESVTESFKEISVATGLHNTPLTYIITDLDIKSETHLEIISSLLSTGEVGGLFAKDELNNICAQLKAALSSADGEFEEIRNVYPKFQYRLRENLHVVLCFSPSSSSFAERAQKFPVLFDATRIDWFLPWPEEALVEVAQSKLLNTSKEDTSLPSIMAKVHEMVNGMCSRYSRLTGFHSYVTPKSFLAYVEAHTSIYNEKLIEDTRLENRVNMGLQKLQGAADNVESMKVTLRKEEAVSLESEKEASALLAKVESESKKVAEKSVAVAAFRDECIARKEAVELERESANQDLEAALPYLREAEEALKGITAKDIVELKTMKIPADIIRLVFDCVLLLFQGSAVAVRQETKVMNKKKEEFIHDSFDEYGRSMLLDIRFMSNLTDFSKNEKDNITDETCEFLEPYLALETFNDVVAKKASRAAEGIFKWVGALVRYHEAAKIVKPKMDEVMIQSARVDVAMKQLTDVESELQIVQETLSELNQSYEHAMETKNTFKQKALATSKIIEKANKLITDLAGERKRWGQDSKMYAERIVNLAGDACIAAAFISYCGVFNHEFRTLILREVQKRCIENGVSTTKDLKIEEFLADQSMIGDWTLQGLPSDEVSIQNAIIVKRSRRFPLMIDPQCQAQSWIQNMELSERGDSGNEFFTTSLQNPRLVEQLKYCITEGKSILIEGIQNEIDPSLFPILNQSIEIRNTKQYIKAFGMQLDYSADFRLYLTTRISQPHFSPELCAMCSVIDFSVSLKGLEQQILGRVISMEQKSLEESSHQLIYEANNNIKSLHILDSLLLEKLTNSKVSLIDDSELIEALATAKAQATVVSRKLEDLMEKKTELNEQREQYLPIAIRGSILYFCMMDMSHISWMYNSGLQQFLEQFDYSVNHSERVPQTLLRVNYITGFLTHQIFQYVTRGLFEKHKRAFTLLLLLRIMLSAKTLQDTDVEFLLNAGADLNASTEPPCPSRWLRNMPEAWMNVLKLSRHQFSDRKSFFYELPELISKEDVAWAKWFKHPEPHEAAVPKYEQSLAADKTLGEFKRLCLVRAFRADRTAAAALKFISVGLGSKYLSPAAKSIESIWVESRSNTPIIFLLSAGMDPTSMIDELAKRKKKYPTSKVAMGEGQEGITKEKIFKASSTGGWVIIQNGHLGIPFMIQLERILQSVKDNSEEFRLWITCAPHPQFPISLLQSSIKVANDPPSGLKPALNRIFSTLVTQEVIDKFPQDSWRSLVYGLAFFHCIIQERKKFGSLGWNIPYEFSTSDFEAALLFAERHFAATALVGLPVSWTTLNCIVAEVHYGGRITDDLDRLLLMTYAKMWFNNDLLAENFGFSSQTTSSGSPLYGVPSSVEITGIREYVHSLPKEDHPNIFGMHVNADLTYRLQESTATLGLIKEISPKDASMTSGVSLEDQVKEKAIELLAKLPKDFNLRECYDKISKWKSHPTSGGGMKPLDIYLYQEIQSMQMILKIVRTHLTNIVNAIDGLIPLTSELQEDEKVLYSMQVPSSWKYDASGAEISWLIPSLGGWFSSLLDRVDQLNSWLNKGRLKGFWLGGFLNPKAFLTAVRQEVTRMHARDKWVMDEVILNTEIYAYDIDKVKDCPDEGVNIYGLTIEGGRWNWHEGKLEESHQGKLSERMPVVHVTAISTKDKDGNNASISAKGAYACPVYKYSMRMEKHLIFKINMKTKTDVAKWTLRGAAIYCLQT